MIFLIVLFLGISIFANNGNIQLVNPNIFLWGVISIISSLILIILYIILYRINLWIDKSEEFGWEKRSKILSRWSNVKSLFVPIYFFIILGTFTFYRNSATSSSSCYFIAYLTAGCFIYFLFLLVYSMNSKFKSYERKINLILTIILPFLIFITITYFLFFLIL